MTGQPERGDVVIRQWGEGRFELLDAETRACVGTSESFAGALAMAGKHPGAVWRAITDNRGRPLGDLTLLRPRVR